ncbi:MAG: hypothetical protein KatS3mg121_1493 [Gammaproteobacteria bacterium]|nr:MAG: hypothetical protein KatS3mg121_1493 [Gammaproteobacteria bacterium]
MTDLPFPPLLLWSTLALAAGLLLGFGLGWALGALRAARLGAALEAERAAGAARIEALNEALAKLDAHFAALAGQALERNNALFLKLAEQNLDKHRQAAVGELQRREQAIEALLRPIRDALEKTDRQLREIEKERKESFGALRQHLEGLAQSQLRLQKETQNLVNALRRPEVRGQWGELTLRRLVELAGMSEHCDFSEQPSVSGEGGVLRPDLIVRMPDRREIVVDAKTPLDAYLTACQSGDENERQAALARHARKMRERVRELAAKAYWAQFENAPDYVVLFVPGEHFLSAALEQDPELLEYALANKVILATPTTLIALLRAVAFGWRQQAVARNAEQIRRLGEELYQRLATFCEHLGRLGGALGNSVEHYNRAVGSLERLVLPGARKFVELGIETRKELVEPEPVDKQTRGLDKPT